MTTNITEEHERAFSAIREAENIALFSCFINGEPGCAIVAINKVDELFHITPLFVSVTDGMKLVNHDGEELTKECRDD